MSLVSVIIPAYNCERYIEDCICSVMNQDFTYFEVIVVNDGSIDNTYTLACKLLPFYSNLYVYTITNSGSNYARAYGVKQSKGEYICFVDADDTLPVNALRILYANCINSNCDIVIGTYNVIYNEKIEEVKGRTGEVSSIDFIKSILSRSVSIGPWGKLYKKILFTDDTFLMPCIMPRGEDAIMNMRLGMRASVVKYVDESVYNYVWHTNSITNTFVTTYDYELTYDNQMIGAIKKKYYELLKEDIIHFRLSLLKTMILSQVEIPQNSVWIHCLLLHTKECHLSLKEKLCILSLHHSLIAKFCRVIYGLKKIL